jgi:hypothetical protein
VFLPRCHALVKDESKIWKIFVEKLSRRVFALEPQVKTFLQGESKIRRQRPWQVPSDAE